jgi:predicted PhzF superfamily epimerase YddE/YHI9
MKLEQYNVFAPESHLEGGKHFALVTDSVAFEEMPEIARLSGVPLTAFIAGTSGSRVNVRFFSSAGKEKPESDSGALVVAYHLGSSCTVVMPGGELLVELESGAAWTFQGDFHIWPTAFDESDWLEALGISSSDLDPFHKIHEAGNSEKRNVVVPVNFSALDSIKPNLERVAELNTQTDTNGLILAAFDSPRAIVDFRFFAPCKGILEDNAGSFTLASLCGYRAAYMAGGTYRWTVAQGFAMGKPSSLLAKFNTRESVAQSVRVGGIVRRIQK